MKYETVIGLEVHAQLNTETKIFCSCSTKFGSGSNTQVCPVCMGLPGVLPVLNENVLKKSILAGLSLNCDINKYSKFDRKNYFYPDLPKAYQISQFDKPICTEGFIEVASPNGPKKIRINRIHMEEDAGKNIHSDDITANYSYVDYNRTGVPLIEIVTEPDLSSGDEAYDYLTQLKQTLRYINVSDCNMEEGSLRCDVNISLRPEGETKLGEKVEIKNMNSFKAVKAAIDYEISRQTDMLDDNEKIVQETRLWNPDKNRTYSMRSKEEAHDYRYFPDPDLPPICIDDDYIKDIQKSLPELPAEKKVKFINDLGLSEYDAGVLTSSRPLAEYYEKVLNLGGDAKKAANWISSELLAKIDDADKIEEFPVTAEKFFGLLKLIDNETISGKIAKKVFTDMIETNKDAETIVDEQGLKQVTDTGEIAGIVDQVISENPKPAEDYKSGNQKAIGFLVGQVMKLSRGKANPQIVNKLLKEKLSTED